MDIDRQQGTNAFARWLWAKIREMPEKGQAEIAREIGITPSSMSTYLSGRALPSRKNLMKIARYFEEDERDLYELIAESEAKEHLPIIATVEEAPEEAMPVIEQLDRDRYIGPEVREWLKRIVITEHRKWRRERDG